ncbi:hypothetical protein ACQKQD_24145 [Methylobacterium sp. NPDC080182]|uniref:hypothetical protein n=1 Tax=Methylobacterium sp. NPDC080182 TaxID=3390590 RepID=UPI003D001623
MRVTAVLFDGETATFQISLPHEPGSRPSIRWMSDHREAPIGYNRARKLWRRYPELMLVSDEAREAPDRLNVDDAEKVLRAEKRRKAALRAAETRRRNREAEKRARGGP